MSVLKLKLDQDALVEDFFEDTWLAGIISQAKDYQLIWQLNKQLGFDFRVNNTLEINLAKNRRSFFFTVYEHQEITKGAGHYFYNNHCKAEFLLPELKHVDYLWLIKGNYYQQADVKALIEQCRKAELVQMASLLDMRDIKNRINLIF
ncbi:IPExxxVDY family protein [Chitinophaga sp. NPDC101104]|uniref:IPExxxVDY family protein n=1 Tax=Chitinophaga sp. NPDC101104 TaxID=3390561 RepID=UPI003D079BEC